MIQNVLLERFSKHGTQWYEARNRESLRLLEQLAEDDSQRWPIIDDVAVAFDRMGKPQEAIPLLRNKLAQQQAADIPNSDLYTTYANLGTLLIHANMAKARQSDAEGIERLNEGLQFIRQSIAANPNAHFGREKWQVAIVEYLSATIATPSLLTTFDCLGNRLDMGIENMLDREMNWVGTRYGRPNVSQLTQSVGKFDEVPQFFEAGTDLNDPANWSNVSPIREYVTTVGAEDGWKEVNVPSHRKAVPFDSPVLGIIGMWRQGGGANPHFALALGETMLRIGHRYIAWNAFERAKLLAERFSDDPAVQDFLKTHSQNRQSAIEETLRFTDAEHSLHKIPWQHVSTPPDSGTIDRLGAAFHEELNFGLAYQAEYQRFEAAQIAAGVAIDDEDFYNAFDANHATIATPVGLEETLLMVPKTDFYAYQRRHRNACSVFGAGLGAMFVAVLLNIRTWFRNKKLARKFAS